MRRPGRRPGTSGTREAILAAAREGFASRGYDQTTIRAIAREAGVDPALVHHFFGTKEELFVAAVRPPASPAAILADLLAADPGGLGERVVRVFLGTWDEEQRRHVVFALLRSATSNERAAELLRTFIAEEIIPGIERALGVPDAGLRGSLIASQLLGLALARYIIRAEPIASADADALARAVGPTIQRYATGDLSG